MPARLSWLFLILVLLMFVLPLPAQVHGMPASVSSFGFGGNFSSAPGVPASVTSLGPNGFAYSPALFGNCCFGGFRTGAHVPVFRGQHHGNRGAFFPTGVAIYAMPYTPVYLVQPDAAAYDDEEYQGGPTVFDRRGTGARQPRERALEQEPEPAAPAVAAVPQEPLAPQPSTVLVFKDGHRNEIQNYAIVGDTLFNLSEGRSYKILLADLDLSATRKANADRGVDFQLPPDSSR
ncbi:MAG TPA: hypothetical protein VLT90_03975 [Terriglobales bacterium]|nr:hypothetical protein [Terriglobales bacterium]